MKHPADEVYTHVIEHLPDEHLERLVDESPRAFFYEFWKIAEVEVELHGRQSRECPWLM